MCEGRLTWPPQLGATPNRRTGIPGTLLLQTSEQLGWIRAQVKMHLHGFSSRAYLHDATITRVHVSCTGTVHSGDLRGLEGNAFVGFQRFSVRSLQGPTFSPLR